MPADLIDPGAAARLCAGQAAVFHAAALSASWGLPAAFVAANVRATAHLLAAARQAGCARFVHVSSPSIYAAMRDRLALTERDPPNPVPLNHYARTKLAAERLVLGAAQPGFATVAIRPRAIVGPDDRVLLPRLAAIAARGRMPLLRGGQALVELTDVRDVVAALLLAETWAEVLSGQAVNVSGGQPVPMREIAGRLAGALGTVLRFVPVPWPAALAAATLAERVTRPDAPEPVLTRYTLATLGVLADLRHGPGAGGPRLRAPPRRAGNAVAGRAGATGMMPARIASAQLTPWRCGPVSVRGVGSAAAHQKRLIPSPLLGGPV